jgi:hypothetical protein
MDPPAAGQPRQRPNFGQSQDFYQPVGNETPAQRGLDWQDQRGTGSSQARTILDDGRGGDDDGEHTIIERGRGSEGLEEPDDDSTVIVRGGRKGVQGPLVYLVQRNGIRAGKVWPLGKETVIGRSRGDDPSETFITVGDETVSRRHAKVRFEEGRFVYWDLASANGSFVVNGDGTRTRILAPHNLQDGDTLEAGEARFTFIEVDSGPSA